jgi:hypothetical protein
MDELTPNWDTDLSPAQVKRLSPKEKGLRTLASMTRKIELIEQISRDGLPIGAELDIPKNRTKLRDWMDPKLRLWAWSCPQVDAIRGKNGDLMARFQSALRILVIRAKKKGLNLQQELRIKEQELKEAHLIIAKLRLQYCNAFDNKIREQTASRIEKPSRR